MLVLSRGKNQSIIIDDHIEITVVEIRPDQIKIGIQAPKSVKVNRKEVYEKIKTEMKKAATSRMPTLDSDFDTKQEGKPDLSTPVGEE